MIIKQSNYRDVLKLRRLRKKLKLDQNSNWPTIYFGVLHIFMLVELDQLYLGFAKKIIDVITEPRMITCEDLWRIGRTPDYREKANRVPIFKRQ